MRSGFTLVELSIVLVIIGLLIGGILVGQSLIANAGLASTISQIQQFDAGVAVFKDKYRNLPGDAPAFGGDGDGLIEWSGAANRNDIFAYEIANFWHHFNPQTYTGSSGTGIKASTSGSEKNVPEAKIGKSESFYIASSVGLGTSSSIGVSNAANPRNFYVLLDPAQAKTPIPTWYYFVQTTSTNSSTKPIELLSLDSKMDDGFANSGDILSGAMGNSGGMYATPLATCSSGATYEVTNDSYECTPIIRIGAQTGETQ